MKYFSTNGNSPDVNFRQALFRGQAPDGGLYLPYKLPRFSPEEQLSLASLSFQKLAAKITETVLEKEIDFETTDQIIDNAFTFDPLLKQLDEYTYCLELFHGPTFSFKDFGAQFMAQAMFAFRPDNEPITVLVATSGDTGSAVAHAFHHIPGFTVVLLYPSKGISPLQEKQLTTIGDNVHAIELKGTFDDCQSLVKQAFKDESLGKQLTLTSANSINIGRLLPQSFYYFWSLISLLDEEIVQEFIVDVPSGNFGNLTGALFAEKMGIRIERFIAAVNRNAVIPDFIQSREYQPRPSVKTLSNAMDVGNPSNWARVIKLYDEDLDKLTKNIWSRSITDEETIETIQEIYEAYSYVIDPHTAVGFKALKQFRTEHRWANMAPAIVAGTAHPGKFHEIVSNALDFDIELPAPLAEILEKQKESTILNNNYNELREFILQLNR
jgi:threonine synthase